MAVLVSPAVMIVMISRVIRTNNDFLNGTVPRSGLAPVMQSSG
jgi:hypothetical protein